MGIAKKLKAALLYNDMTQVELAEKLGKSHSAVRNAIFNGNITYNNLEEMAGAIGCDVVLRDRKTGKIFD